MDRKENKDQDLVALPGVVGWSVPVRWALVVAGWVVTVVPGPFSCSLLCGALFDSRAPGAFSDVFRSYEGLSGNLLTTGLCTFPVV